MGQVSHLQLFNIQYLQFLKTEGNHSWLRLLMAITVKNKEKHKDIMLKVCKKNVYSFLHYIQVHLTKVLFNDQMSNAVWFWQASTPQWKLSQTETWLRNSVNWLTWRICKQKAIYLFKLKAYARFYAEISLLHLVYHVNHANRYILVSTELFNFGKCTYMVALFILIPIDGVTLNRFWSNVFAVS